MISPTDWLMSPTAAVAVVASVPSSSAVLTSLFPALGAAGQKFTASGTGDNETKVQ